MLVRVTFEVRANGKNRGAILRVVTCWTLRAWRRTRLGGGQSAGVAAPAVFTLRSHLPSPAHHTPQTGSHFLPQSLKSALETFAKQSVEQRIDVRVQQHQPVGEGNSRCWDEGGLAWDRSFCGLNQSNSYVRCPAQEEGWDDQKETHHSMVTVVLLGVLQGRLGRALSQEGEQTSGWRVTLLCRWIRESRIAIISFLTTDLRNKLSTYMIDHLRGAVEAPTLLLRWITRAWIPAALDRVLQSMNPSGVAACHLDDVHVAEEDDHSRHGVGKGSHASRVAGTAGPVDCTAVHGNHITDRAPAQQGRATGDQCLQPDPQDHSTGPPKGAAGAVAQAVHDGVVAIEGNSSQCQHRGCTVHRGGVTHVQTEVLSDRRGSNTSAWNRTSSLEDQRKWGNVSQTLKLWL